MLLIMDDLIPRLYMSLTASCTCMCKTPVVDKHDPMCRYRLTHESINEISRLRDGLKEIIGNDPVEDTWEEVVQPFVERFNVAAKFGADAVHNGEGSKAMGELIGDMARRLDSAIIKIRALIQAP